MSGLAHEVRKNSALFLMVVPALVLLVLFNYLPMAGAVIAFKDYHYDLGIFRSAWYGFRNFAFLFTSKDAFTITRNTILYNLIFIVLGQALAIVFAIALSEIRAKRIAKIYQTLMFLPYFLSWVIVSYLVFAFLSADKGFVNSALTSISPGAPRMAWYSETRYWPFFLVAIYLWKFTGYNCIIYLAGIVGIDAEMYEAAVLDGANKFQQIRRITLPMLAPLVVVLVILAVGRIFYADFGLFYQVPRNSGSLYPVTNVIDTYVYNALRTVGDIGMSSAAGLYQSVVGFLLVLLSNLVVKRVRPEYSLF